MSSQKGNVKRSGPPKHQNSTVFKNTLNDTSKRTKTIVSLKVENVCHRCKDILEWKIKYKKYKPLTQPKTCCKCSQKTIKFAYHVICTACVLKNNICGKCMKPIDDADLTTNPSNENFELTKEMKDLVKILPERKKRTFQRFMQKKQDEIKEGHNKAEAHLAIIEKLNSLSVDSKNLQSNDKEDSDNLQFSDEEDLD